MTARMVFQQPVNIPMLFVNILIMILFVPAMTSMGVSEEETAMEKNWHVATFGGGCFWCMVPPFENLSGVKKVVSGYMGGDTPHPTYAEVSEGNSGYLEVVQVEFDPALAPYRKLLDVFWRNIDPTDSKGQFADRGRQYQTAIFFHTPDQETEARRSKEDLAASGRFNAPIVTDIRPAKIFYPAEDYHQDYHKKNPLRYGLYRQGSGRDRFIKKAWGDRDNDVDPANNPKIIERKKTLTPIQYRVTQECGTEPPFDNEYWDNHEEGIYVDIVSGEPLFISKDKFDSGTGWPSFTRPLEPDNIVEKIDAGLLTRRTEVRSKKGGSHLGHVFDDGPGPTGLRYCINSAALKFIPVADLEKEGYGKYLSVFSLESSGAPTRKRR